MGSTTARAGSTLIDPHPPFWCRGPVRWFLASGGGHERIAHACGHEAENPSLEVEVHEVIFVAGIVHQVRGEASREVVLEVPGKVIGQDNDTVGRNPKAFDHTFGHRSFLGRLEAFESDLCRWSGAGRTWS
jgi:hypothetical protein